MAMFTELAPLHSGTLYAISDTLAESGSILGVYGVGLVLEYYESWTIVFVACGIVCFLGAFPFLILSSTRPILRPEFESETDSETVEELEY